MLSFGFSKRIFFPLFFFSLWNIVACCCCFFVDTLFSVNESKWTSNDKRLFQNRFLYVLCVSFERVFSSLFDLSMLSHIQRFELALRHALKGRVSQKRRENIFMRYVLYTWACYIYRLFWYWCVCRCVCAHMLCVCVLNVFQQRFAFSCSCYCCHHQFSSTSNSCSIHEIQFWQEKDVVQNGFYMYVIDSHLFVALVAHSDVVRPFTAQRDIVSFHFFLFTSVRLLRICLEKISGIESWDKVQEKSRILIEKEKTIKKIVDHMIFVVVHSVCLLFFCSPRMCSFFGAHNFSVFFCYGINRNGIGSHRFLTQFYRLYRLLELLEQAKHLIPFKKWSLLINAWKKEICTLHSSDSFSIPLYSHLWKSWEINLRFHG